MDDLKEIENNDLLGFINQINSVIKKQGTLEQRVDEMGESILSGFEKNETALNELTRLFKTIVSQLDSPLKTNLDYERMYPEKIKVSNLDELKIPDEIKLKQPEWYREPNLEPVIEALRKQYSVSLEDIVHGSKSSATSGQATLIRGQEGYKIYLTDITITNYSGNSAYVDIYNGNTNWTIPAPINGGVGGATLHFATPLPGALDESWYFRVTPATNIVYCSVVGFKRK